MNFVDTHMDKSNKLHTFYQCVAVSGIENDIFLEENTFIQSSIKKQACLL